MNVKDDGSLDATRYIEQHISLCSTYTTQSTTHAFLVVSVCDIQLRYSEPLHFVHPRVLNNWHDCQYFKNFFFKCTFSINNVLEKNYNGWQLIILNILSTARFPSKGCLRNKKYNNVIATIMERKHVQFLMSSSAKIKRQIATINSSTSISSLLYSAFPYQTTRSSVLLPKILSSSVTCCVIHQIKTKHSTILKKSQHYCFVSVTRITVILEIHSFPYLSINISSRYSVTSVPFFSTLSMRHKMIYSLSAELA